MRSEPIKQIHLDFHTSEAIPGIGSRFEKVQFQEALKIGRVDLINVFAKGHHGWCYYPTKVGQVHPNLDFDLLGSQIEACHEIDVAAPIYVTVGWSANDAEEHPEWCMRTIDGSFVAPTWPADVTEETPKPTFQWKLLCPSGEYHQLVCEHTAELLKMYDVDGFWYDIYQPNHLCYCETCRKGMVDGGFDVNLVRDVERYRAETIRSHCAEVCRTIAGKDPEASIYFNGLTSLERPHNLRYRLYEYNTKNDLEDLPTTWGGYDKLPIRAKIFAAERKPIIAMSGKFHTAWGEFGGFKSPEAIRFEAASMIAFGVRCNFGDQLHPNGAMDLSTYSNIGHGFSYVEKISDYGIPSLPASSLGVLVSGDLAADEGVARMLLEEQIDFDVVRPGVTLTRFETVIIPSTPGLIDDMQAIVEMYLATGGTVVVLGRGLLEGAGIDTALDFGLEYKGEGNFDIDYTRLRSDFLGASGSFDLPDSPFLNYTSGSRFLPPVDAEIYADIYEPYFSRTYGTYCGHQNTPYRNDPAPHPAVLRSGRIYVTAHNLDRMYYHHGAKVHRDLFTKVLRLAHRHPMIEADLPSAGRVNLLHQPEKHRYAAHLLYGPPLQRGRCLVIEDLPELHDIDITLRLPKEPTSLRLEPAGIPLEMQTVVETEPPVLPVDFSSWTTVKTRIQSFAAHCIVVAEY